MVPCMTCHRGVRLDPSCKPTHFFESLEHKACRRAYIQQASWVHVPIHQSSIHSPVSEQKLSLVEVVRVSRRIATEVVVTISAVHMAIALFELGELMTTGITLTDPVAMLPKAPVRVAPTDGAHWIIHAVRPVPKLRSTGL